MCHDGVLDGGFEPSARVVMIGARQPARMTYQAVIDYVIAIHVLAATAPSDAVPCVAADCARQDLPRFKPYLRAGWFTGSCLRPVPTRELTDVPGPYLGRENVERIAFEELSPECPELDGAAACTLTQGEDWDAGDRRHGRPAGRAEDIRAGSLHAGALVTGSARHRRGCGPLDRRAAGSPVGRAHAPRVLRA